MTVTNVSRRIDPPIAAGRGRDRDLPAVFVRAGGAAPGDLSTMRSSIAELLVKRVEVAQVVCVSFGA